MTKQEEIREGITDIIKESIPNFIYPFLMIPTRWLVNKILSYLHSQGVVIKVDRKLPKFPPNSELHPYGQAYVKGGRAYVQSLIDAGYVAIKPLIKE